MSVAIRIIPCLDVKDGRVVKGVNFAGLRDAGDPVELARRYDAQGADEITFLDVSASAEGRATMVDVVSAAADQVFVPLTVGGGVRTVQDVARLLAAGADKVGVNTAAVARPELLGEVADRFGNQDTTTVCGPRSSRRVTAHPRRRRRSPASHRTPRQAGPCACMWRGSDRPSTDRLCSRHTRPSPGRHGHSRHR